MKVLIHSCKSKISTLQADARFLMYRAKKYMETDYRSVNH